MPAAEDDASVDDVGVPAMIPLVRYGRLNRDDQGLPEHVHCASVHGHAGHVVSTVLEHVARCGRGEKYKYIAPGSLRYNTWDDLSLIQVPIVFFHKSFMFEQKFTLRVYAYARRDSKLAYLLCTFEKTRLLCSSTTPACRCSPCKRHRLRYAPQS